ncbi:ATP-binding cassette permease mdl1 [Tulasnella sp. 418]|nr:ATP-binding cassette permease mdl1 [Tulasnella sp. 418]
MSFPSASFLGGFCRTSAYRVHLSPHIRISIRSLSSHVSVTPTSRSFRISQLPQRLYRPQHLPLQWRSISSTPDQPSQPNPAEAKKSTSILARLLPSSISPTADSTSSLRKIIALAKPEKKIIGIAVSLLFVSSAVSMSIPFTVGRLIDYFSSANANLFMGLSPTNALIVLTLVFTAGGLANAGRVILLRLAGLRIVSRLRTDAYKAALRQEVEYVERGAGEGDLISRLNVDAGIVGESVTQNLSDGLRSIVTASVGLTAMFWLSPTMTLLMLSIVPPVSIGAVIYGRYLKSISRKTQQALGDMSKVAHETLHSLRIVQAFNAYGLEEKKFHKKVWNVADFLRKEAWASGTFFGSTGWAGNVTILMLLGYGGTLVSRGEISVGDLTSLLLYTAYVGSSLTTLSSFFVSSRIFISQYLVTLSSQTV